MYYHGPAKISNPEYRAYLQGERRHVNQRSTVNGGSWKLQERLRHIRENNELIEWKKDHQDEEQVNWAMKMAAKRLERWRLRKERNNNDDDIESNQRTPIPEDDKDLEYKVPEDYRVRHFKKSKEDIYYLFFKVDDDFVYSLRRYESEIAYKRATKEEIKEYLAPIEKRFSFYKSPKNPLVIGLVMLLTPIILLLYWLWSCISACFRLRDRFSPEGNERWTQDYIKKTAPHWAARGLMWHTSDMHDGIELHVLEFPQSKSKPVLQSDVPKQEQAISLYTTKVIQKRSENPINLDIEEQRKRQQELEPAKIVVKPNPGNDRGMKRRGSI